VLIRSFLSLTFSVFCRIPANALGLMEPLEQSSAPNPDCAAHANMAQAREARKSTREHLAKVRFRIVKQLSGTFQIEDLVRVTHTVVPLLLPQFEQAPDSEFPIHLAYS